MSTIRSFEPKPARETPKLLAQVRELGDMAAFSTRAIFATPGALRYFAEALRQIGTLVVGTTLVLLALEAVIGGECALFFVYLVRPLGAGSFTGFFEVPCGIRELYPYMFGYIFAAKVGCGLVAEIVTPLRCSSGAIVSATIGQGDAGPMLFTAAFGSEHQITLAVGAVACNIRCGNAR